MNGNAVVDHVKVVLVKIDDSFTGGIFDESIPYIPLFRYGPVEDLRAGGNLENPERDAFADRPQSFANPVAGDASANRVEGSREIV